ncbi:tail fiber protein [bacterium AH-315-J04]|nr:tail fiber protein [bacterium AH-315-J04]
METTGMIVGYMGNKIPNGWLLCDGGEIPDDGKFNALRTMIGNTLPDMRSNRKHSVTRGTSRSQSIGESHSQGTTDASNSSQTSTSNSRSWGTNSHATAQTTSRFVINQIIKA